MFMPYYFTRSKMKKFLLLFFLLSSITACTTPMSSSGAGWILTSTLEGQSANNGVEINKKGESCQISILGLVASGNSSVKEAKEDGHIKNIATIDRSYFGILGLFGKSCLIVQGN